MMPTGYVYVLTGGAGQRKRAPEHRVVWQAAFGPIPPRHHIHHRNGIKDDNRLENLMLVGAAEHNELHFGLPVMAWSRTYDACVQCGERTRPHKANGLCTRCYQRKN